MKPYDAGRSPKAQLVTQRLISGRSFQSPIPGFLLFGSLVLGPLFPVQAGSFSGVGVLSGAREGHTATLLPNGKILVVGGMVGGLAVDSTELYDPATGKWTTGAHMRTVHYRHSATLLTNGMVLVAGGAGGTTPAAELYDPVTGSWIAPGIPMLKPRDRHTATLLKNGMVLVVGGNDGTNETDSIESYNPESQTWSQVGFLQDARFSHTATLLPDNRVLVVGGLKNGGSDLVSDAEILDSNGASTRTKNGPTPRWGHTATLLHSGSGSGKVLVAGGSDLLTQLESCELYDLSQDTWTSTRSLVEPRTAHTATLRPAALFVAVEDLGMLIRSPIMSFAPRRSSTPPTATPMASGRQPALDSQRPALTAATGPVLLARGDSL